MFVTKGKWLDDHSAEPAVRELVAIKESEKALAEKANTGNGMPGKAFVSLSDINRHVFCSYGSGAYPEFRFKP